MKIWRYQIKDIKIFLWCNFCHNSLPSTRWSAHIDSHWSWKRSCRFTRWNGAGEVYSVFFMWGKIHWQGAGVSKLEHVAWQVSCYPLGRQNILGVKQWEKDALVKIINHTRDWHNRMIWHVWLLLANHTWLLGGFCSFFSAPHNLASLSQWCELCCQQEYI